MRRRQIYAERYPSSNAFVAAMDEVAAEIIRPLLEKETCPQCGKTGLKNVGAHRRFCKG
jgi:hypothetical protein